MLSNSPNPRRENNLGVAAEQDKLSLPMVQAEETIKPCKDLFENSLQKLNQSAGRIVAQGKFDQRLMDRTEKGSSVAEPHQQSKKVLETTYRVYLPETDPNYKLSPLSVNFPHFDIESEELVGYFRLKHVDHRTDLMLQESHAKLGASLMSYAFLGAVVGAYLSQGKCRPLSNIAGIGQSRQLGREMDPIVYNLVKAPQEQNFALPLLKMTYPIGVRNFKDFLARGVRVTHFLENTTEGGRRWGVDVYAPPPGGILEKVIADLKGAGQDDRARLMAQFALTNEAGGVVKVEGATCKADGQKRRWVQRCHCLEQAASFFIGALYAASAGVTQKKN